MAVSPEALDHAPTTKVQPPVAIPEIPEITLLEGEQVSLDGPRPDNVAGLPDYAALAGETGSMLTPEERERAALENYREMGGTLSEGSFRIARKVLAYPNGDSSPVNRRPLSMEIDSGVTLTERQRNLYRALSEIRGGSLSDQRLFADVIFPLTGSGKRNRKIRARFERHYPNIFKPS